MGGGKGKIRPEDGRPFVKNDPRINRKGRPVKLPDLDALLIDILGEPVRGREALKGVLLALRKKAVSGDVRAAELLLDRAYGKLKQSTGLDIDVKRLSDNQLEELIERLFKDK